MLELEVKFTIIYVKQYVKWQTVQTTLYFSQLSESAFPSKEEIDILLESMSSTSTDGFTLDELMERCNLRFGQIEKALRFLAAEDESPVRKVCGCPVLAGILFTRLTREMKLEQTS